MSFLVRLKFLPFYILSILPMPVLYFISDIVYLLVFYVIGYRKRIVLMNLENAFPEKDKDEILQVAKKFYKHFCDVALEAIKTLTISQTEAKKRLVVRNPEMLEELLNSNKNILLYTAHQGNWEWLVYLPIYFGYPAYTMYRPLKNKYFNELFLIMRNRFGVHCIDAKRGYRSIIEQEKLRQPVINCVIGDQSPHRLDKKKWYNFFNRETAFFVGVEKIASRTSSAVIFPSFTKVSRGFYELEFELVENEYLDDENSSVINNYAQLLEDKVSKYPELWLWSHRRWKLSPQSLS